MKKLLILIMLLVNVSVKSQEWTHCITTNNYETNSKKHSKEITYCDNKLAFGIFNGSWKRVWKISDYRQSLSKDGFLVEKFCNAADEVSNKADYLVTITHSSPATILIQFTLGEGGYWYIKTNEIAEIKEQKK